MDANRQKRQGTQKCEDTNLTQEENVRSGLLEGVISPT